MELANTGPWLTPPDLPPATAATVARAPPSLFMVSLDEKEPLRYSLFLGGLAHPKARTMPSCVCFRKSCVSVLNVRLGAPWGNIFWDWLLDKVHAN